MTIQITVVGYMFYTVVGYLCTVCLWITLWITCGYVDNFLLVYVFVLCVYGFLWVESDKFYMFECVVDNFVDNSRYKNVSKNKSIKLYR